MSKAEMTGGCMCGRIRYSAEVENDEAYLCHCRMCQRASGNISLAMKNVKKADVSWETEPDYYESSPIARRGYCSACGTSLTFEFPDSENMDLIVGSFDDPGLLRPVHHFGAESMHRAWINTEGLPEIRTEEHKALVDRWMKAVGKLQADLPVQHFTARDGVRLAYREMGEGRPLVLIHGYFSNAFINWVRYGHAAGIAARGFRVIMPDLRAHGDSDKPHDLAAYPPDILAEDGFALIDHIGLDDYDLGGYSLGGRTVVRMLAKGAKPRRAAVSGMGLQGILHTEGRGEYFRNVLTQLGTFPRGSSEWMTEAFLKTTGGDPEGLLLILNTFANTSREELASINLPVLVVTGEDDDDNGSGEALARALPQGRFQPVPGNHMSAVVKPELGRAIADFLAA